MIVRSDTSLYPFNVSFVFHTSINNSENTSMMELMKMPLSPTINKYTVYSDNGGGDDGSNDNYNSNYVNKDDDDDDEVVILKIIIVTIITVTSMIMLAKTFHINGDVLAKYFCSSM